MIVRTLLRIGCVVIVLGTLTWVVAAAMTTTRAIALPPSRAYAAPVINAVMPDADRIPVAPMIADRTVLAPLPLGLGVGAVPAGTARPIRTNAWWSSGSLEPWPAPLYPLPFKGVFNADGLTLSLLGRRSEGKTIFGKDVDPLRIFTAQPAIGAQVIAAGDWDVSLRVRGSSSPFYDATFIQGSPFVFLRPVVPLKAALPAGATTLVVDCKTECGSAVLIKAPGGATYLLVSSVSNAFTVRGGVIDVRTGNARSLLTVTLVAPESDPKAYLSAAMRPFTGTQMEYAVTDADVFTTFRYPVTTIMGILPHHFASLSYKQEKGAPAPFINGNPGRLLGTFETLRGPVRFYAAGGFRTVLPRPSVLPGLPPLSVLATDPALRQTLQREVTGNIPPAGDVYSGGKSLLRTAMLAALADSLREGDLWTQALGQARESLIRSCTATPGAIPVFAFDPVAGGIIALPSAFGSEHYNDHHFHAGYVIHAAAIVARYDPLFAQQYGDCIRLLIRDIAATDRRDLSFPFLRVFDPFGGHSWANGLTLFADGTNQESMSEALQAWYAIALFGRTTGDRTLEQLGTWLYAQEAQAMRVYWLNAAPETQAFPAFPFPIISILWSGKADYATFFDPADAAIRGIQFFPVSPALFPVIDAGIVSRIIAPVTGGAPTIWTTGLSLIEGMFGPGRAIPSSAPIDPVYSRTYTGYWQKAVQILGAPAGSTGSCSGQVFRKGHKLTAVLYRFPGDPATCKFMLGLRSVSLVNLNIGWNIRAL